MGRGDSKGLWQRCRQRHDCGPRGSDCGCWGLIESLHGTSRTGEQLGPGGSQGGHQGVGVISCLKIVDPALYMHHCNCTCPNYKRSW